MHHNKPEELLVGERADLTIISVHGRGRSPDDMRALAKRLRLDNVRYLFPVATNNTWYPALFMDPIADNEPSLSAAIAHYEDLVSSLISQGTPAERIVVGGFSQGACLTAEFLARHPRRYAAAVLWTGGLIGPEGTTWPLQPVLAGLPVYISTSETDPWVPAPRVRETHHWLKASGASATMMIFQEREHGVLDEEVGAVRSMIERTRSSVRA
jgi:phospholipase/carboxylesterase